MRTAATPQPEHSLGRVRVLLVLYSLALGCFFPSLIGTCFPCPRESQLFRVTPPGYLARSERTQNPIPGAPAHMLPVRTLCPTYDPSECASRPNQVQAMYRNETAERLACLVMRCSAAILALECSPCWILKGQAARG